MFPLQLSADKQEEWRILKIETLSLMVMSYFLCLTGVNYKDNILEIGFRGPSRSASEILEGLLSQEEAEGIIQNITTYMYNYVA